MEWIRWMIDAYNWRFVNASLLLDIVILVGSNWNNWIRLIEFQSFVWENRKMCSSYLYIVSHQSTLVSKIPVSVETEQCYSIKTVYNNYCQVIDSISKHTHFIPKMSIAFKTKYRPSWSVIARYSTHFRYHARGSNSSKDQADWHSLLTFFAVFPKVWRYWPVALLVQLGTKAPLRRTGYMAIRAGWHQLSNKLTSSHDTKVNPLLHLFPSIIRILYSAAGRSLDDRSISRRYFARNFLGDRFDDRYSKSLVYQ